MNRARALIATIFLSTILTAQAQSSWDGVLAGSEWYVPSQNLLAYLASGSDLTDLDPIADQTIWDITSCVDGAFTGTSTETFLINGIPVNASATMNGTVEELGQIRIVFTGNSGEQTIGIGQVKMVDDTPAMQMQMITGSSSYLSHWANMEPYDENSTTLPPLVIPDVTIDQEWSWMKDTNWAFQDTDLFAGGPGAFQIQGYDNGYFWGMGTGPEPTSSFTLLGSATPEGTILFNILSGTTLTSLAGQITGTATDGMIAMRVYDTSGDTGEVGTARVIPLPEPSSITLLVGGCFLVVLVGMVRRPKSSIAG